jgi:hypothetical protein
MLGCAGGERLQNSSFLALQVDDKSDWPHPEIHVASPQRLQTSSSNHD